MTKRVYTATFKGPRPAINQLAVRMNGVVVEVEVFEVKRGVWNARAKATRAEFANCVSPSDMQTKEAVGSLFAERTTPWSLTDQYGCIIPVEELRKLAGESTKTAHSPRNPDDATKDRLSNAQMDYVYAVCGRRVYRMDLAQPGQAPTCSMCAKAERKAKATAEAGKQKTIGPELPQ